MTFFDKLTKKKTTTVRPLWTALPMTAKHNRRVRRHRRVVSFA